LLVFLLAILVPGCSPILLPILLLPSLFSILAGQSCEAETDVTILAWAAAAARLWLVMLLLLANLVNGGQLVMLLLRFNVRKQL
jgi:hypothetical protein